MKKPILTLFILFPFFLFAQKNFYKELENTEQCRYYVEKILELKNTNLLVIANKTPCEQDVTLSLSNFIILDAKGKELKKTKFERDDKYIDVILDIVPFNNQYFAIGKAYDKKELSITLVFYVLDANFNVINSKTVQPDKDNEYVELYDVKLYLEGNQAYFSTTYDYGSLAFNPSIGMAGKIKTDFSNLIINTFSTEFKATIEGGLDITKRLDANGYLLDGYTVIYFLDDSLNLEKKQDAEFDDFDQRRRRYKNKYITVAQNTFEITPNDPLGPAKFDIGVKILDAQLKVEKLALIGKSIAKGALRDTYDLPGKRGLSWKDPNKIYVCGLTFKEFKPTSFTDNDTWINVSQLDSNLVVKWTKYFWGDGSNLAFGVTATDGGVIVYGSRDSLKSGISNAFVMKLSSDGLLDEQNIDEFANTNIKIGPNPFKDYCTFAVDDVGDNRTIKLEIFNVLGQKEFSQELGTGLNKIDLAALSSGNYFYNLMIDNKLMKKGKLIKLN